MDRASFFSRPQMDCSFSGRQSYGAVVRMGKRAQNKVQFFILSPQKGFSESKVKQGIVFPSGEDARGGPGGRSLGKGRDPAWHPLQLPGLQPRSGASGWVGSGGSQ